MNSALDALTQRYLAALPEKRDEIERVYQASLVPGQVTVNRVLLQVLLDRLSGSAGAYGFSALGEAARSACLQIESDHKMLVPAEMNGDRAARFALLMERVLASFETALVDLPKSSAA